MLIDYSMSYDMMNRHTSATTILSTFQESQTPKLIKGEEAVDWTNCARLNNMGLIFAVAVR
jgi:hypothetical protein